MVRDGHVGVVDTSSEEITNPKPRWMTQIDTGVFSTC